MSEGDKGDSMDRLERDLYTRKDESAPRSHEHMLEGKVLSVRHRWHPHGGGGESTSTEGSRKFGRYVLFGSMAFFLISTGIAAYFFFGGVNLVSPRKIDIAIAGPIAVDAGEEVPLSITVRNHNVAPLEGAHLVIQFPEGTRSAANPHEEFVRYRETLGNVEPGKEYGSAVRALVFGEQGERKVIKVTLEYRVAGSGGLFVKEQIYEVVIGTPSVRVSVSSVQEITSGQEMEFQIEVASNADSPIENVLLFAEYPSGFAFTSSSPEPLTGNGLWRIGTLEPEGRAVITLRGIVEGLDGDERAFHFTAGIQNSADEVRIGTPLLSTSRNVIIKKPFIGVSLLVNGERAGTHPVTSRSVVRVEIDWMNNLPTRIIDAQIEAILSGDAFDRQSIQTTDGFYRSSDHTVLWNAQTVPGLLEIESGKRGRVNFTLSMLDFTRLSGGVIDPSATITVNVKGRRVSEVSVPETIAASARTTLNVASETQLSARAGYTSGPFKNTGPIPPKAEAETTYTIFWSVTNTTSDVRDAEVSATLPPNVRWVGVVSPTSEQVNFVPVGGKIVWNLGKVLAGTGRDRPTREVAFQVALTPSVTDIGSTPSLIRDARLIGTDEFADVPIERNASGVSTFLSTEPNFDFKDATVVP
jgi:hypothetical protein